MKTAEYQEVFYPVSAYVWCKGVSNKLGRHPIFVSSPVEFISSLNGRYTVLTCHQPTCSFCGAPARYEEREIGFQDEILPRRPSTGIKN